MPSFKTTIKDKAFKQAMKAFKAVKNKPSVKIGILEQEGDHKESEGLTVAEVATFNEFGTETSPERSFIRSTVDQNQRSYIEKTEKLQEKMVLNGMTAEVALSVLGEQIQTDIVKTIDSGVSPANSPETIKAKGSSKPLIDSAQMKQSVRYKVDL